MILYLDTSSLIKLYIEMFDFDPSVLAKLPPQPTVAVEPEMVEAVA